MFNGSGMATVKKRLYAMRLAYLFYRDVFGDQMRKHHIAHPERQESRQHRGDIRHQRCCHKHLACALADVGDGWRDKTHDNQRYNKSEKLAEQPVERDKQTHHHFRHHKSCADTQHNRYDNSGQQPNSKFLHHTIFLQR